MSALDNAYASVLGWLVVASARYEQAGWLALACWLGLSLACGCMAAVDRARAAERARRMCAARVASRASRGEPGTGPAPDERGGWRHPDGAASTDPCYEARNPTTRNPKQGR